MDDMTEIIGRQNSLVTLMEKINLGEGRDGS